MGFEIGLADEEPFIEKLPAAPEVESFDVFFDEGDEMRTPSYLFYVKLNDRGRHRHRSKEGLTQALQMMAA